jgi:hypothetical protein
MFPCRIYKLNTEKITPNWCFSDSYLYEFWDFHVIKG